MDSPQHSATQILLEEPFRVMFPVGVLATLLGVVPWLTFALGWTQPPSSYSHGMLQIQCFEASFATGFLMTALPRFLETTPTRWWELLLGVCLALAMTLALATQNLRLGQWLFLALLVHMLMFGARRLRTRGDDPPPFFAFLPIGLTAGLVGSVAILRPIESLPRLGENLIQQGILLCLVLAVGSHLGPRLLYGHRGFPETTTPAAHRRAAGLFLLGLLLLVSFFIEAAGARQAGLILRATIVTGYLLTVLRIYRVPTTNLLHVHLLRLSFVMLLLGLWVAAIAPPPHQIASLHLTFVGGLGLMTFVIASRVVIGHTGFEDLWQSHRAALVIPLSLIALATPLRLAADALPDHYTAWLGASSAAWVGGVALWGVIFVPKMSPRHVADD
ncbi:MAG: NnrS family protein [Gemmatimonadetes bacterium]|jgi:uncharacterized protein involved in response to NO|nr:NnrS family protein [Gemmatimonadota bacterium]MBT4612775.1 NnrS family protein [Gemmatimonadota bacterium]MBT5142929.1 NnrS family protein [Gemmatimonadota bacterium]MBT5589523.1 NnrS family protein [Gemmatimonadota bacterium]MBT5959936.1 NnrS family protein [Gemmatimonadota bacterium]